MLYAIYTTNLSMFCAVARGAAINIHFSTYIRSIPQQLMSIFATLTT